MDNSNLLSKKSGKLVLQNTHYSELDLKFCRSLAISCHVMIHIIKCHTAYYNHALALLWFRLLGPMWRSWSANRYCCVGKSQWLASIRWWLANANEHLALLAIGWSERVVFPKNMAFIWGYPGSWLGTMATLRTPLKQHSHGFYSHANKLQNVWLQSTGHDSSQGDSFSRWCDEYIRNKKHRNYRSVVCETCWHMPVLQYQASTPLGSVITPHNQPCQYHEHNIEGHCYPEVVTLTNFWNFRAKCKIFRITNINKITSKPWTTLEKCRVIKLFIN